jgi:ABC-type dipeptide/oligopeptide/nickel transport system permease subunit
VNLAWIVIPVALGVAITVLFLNWLAKRLANALNDWTDRLFKRR